MKSIYINQAIKRALLCLAKSFGLAVPSIVFPGLDIESGSMAFSSKDLYFLYIFILRVFTALVS